MQDSNDMAVKDHDLLIEVNTNVKNLTTTLHTYMATAGNTIQDHEERLRTVESRQTSLRGDISGTRRTTNIALSILGLATAVIGTVVAVMQFRG